MAVPFWPRGRLGRQADGGEMHPALPDLSLAQLHRQQAQAAAQDAQYVRYLSPVLSTHK